MPATTPRPIHDILSISPVIPVVSIARVEDAVPLANALLEGGVSVIEVTLRTDAAVTAIAKIVQEVPDMCVGAGTVWNRQAAKAVRKAGVEFVVTPGRSDQVWKYCDKHKLPLLPGTQTTSEIALWVERGLTAVKFFPAEVAGGVKAIKSFQAVFAGLKFCPTGGISSASAPDYLALDCVPCVGGSWLVDKQAVADGDWSRITEAAAATQSLIDSTADDAPPWN